MFLAIIFFGAVANAQTEKIIEPNVGFLNHIIVGDTAADGSRVDTKYILRRDAEYLISGSFENHGWKLHIEAEAGTGGRLRIEVQVRHDDRDGTCVHAREAACRVR